MTSKSSNVHDITTGKPLKPVKDAVWLITLYKARLDQDDIIAKAISLVPQARWGTMSGAEKTAFMLSVVNYLLADLAQKEISDYFLDVSESDMQDAAYVEVLTESAIGEAINEIMPRAEKWADGMSEDEIGDKIAVMLSEFAAETLPG